MSSGSGADLGGCDVGGEGLVGRALDIGRREQLQMRHKSDSVVFSRTVPQSAQRQAARFYSVDAEDEPAADALKAGRRLWEG